MLEGYGTPGVAIFRQEGKRSLLYAAFVNLPKSMTTGDLLHTLKVRISPAPSSGHRQ